MERPIRIRLAVACLLGAVVVIAPGTTLRAEESDRAPSALRRLPMPTLGGTQFWADELFFHRWRIQRKTGTTECRLLDANNLCHASGTFEKCRAALEEVKYHNGIEPMQGTGVILLHGLGDTRGNMARMAKYIERHSDYRTFNVAYPSTRQDIERHARSLARVVENLEGVDSIHFVGHSMGNIVVRRYLVDRADEAAGRRPGPRLGRIVMIGPPNHGSIAATSLADNRVFQAILGEPGQQLGPEWVWLESSLATPRVEFGIIAGGLGNRLGINPLLPGDNDGLLTVRSTRLAGAADFRVVPVLHALLPGDRKVQQYTLRFLKHGYFVAPDQRRPVGDKTEQQMTNHE